MNKKLTVIIWILAVFMLLTAAYSFYNKNKSKELLPPQTQNTSTVGENTIMAPDFSLKDLDGNTVKLSDYKGKIVILNFWAVWCKYCKQEMPDLNELSKELQKDGDAVILAVDSQESLKTVEKYVSSNKFDLKVLLDEDGSITEEYGITGFPTTFIINSDGSLYFYISGMTDKETLKNYIEKSKRGEAP